MRARPITLRVAWIAASMLAVSGAALFAMPKVYSCQIELPGTQDHLVIVAGVGRITFEQSNCPYPAKNSGWFMPRGYGIREAAERQYRTRDDWHGNFANFDNRSGVERYTLGIGSLYLNVRGWPTDPGVPAWSSSGIAMPSWTFGVPLGVMIARHLHRRMRRARVARVGFPLDHVWDTDACARKRPGPQW
jgi:hypothetical protein